MLAAVVRAAARSQLTAIAPDAANSADTFTTTQWANLNAFAARLTALGIPAFDFSLYAVWMLRDAFELGNAPTEAQLSAASVWMTYAGEPLLRLSNEERSFEGQLAAPGSTYSQRNWTGFNRERLHVWEGGLYGGSREREDTGIARL